MSFISRGFTGRRRDPELAGRVPPGQYVTDDFPVLSAGPTPHTRLDEWTFAIEGGAEPVSWTWEELRALPSEAVTKDIHCVTKWSKFVFFQAEDGIRDVAVTGVQTCALPI